MKMWVCKTQILARHIQPTLYYETVSKNFLYEYIFIRNMNQGKDSLRPELYFRCIFIKIECYSESYLSIHSSVARSFVLMTSIFLVDPHVQNKI